MCRGWALRENPLVHMHGGIGDRELYRNSALGFNPPEDILGRLGLNFHVSDVRDDSVNQEVSVGNAIFTDQDLDQLALLVDAHVPDPISIDLA